MSKRAVHNNASSGAAAAGGSVASVGPEDDNPAKWSQALRRDVDWRKKDLCEVIFWIRQVLALVLGIAFGIAGLTGLPTILLFLGLNSASLFVYYTRFLQVDDEEDAYGRWDLLTEGLWPSFAFFILTWTVTYSLGF
jgi:predicted membrane metal-binding protein